MYLRLFLLAAAATLPYVSWAQIVGRGLTAPTNLEYVGRQMDKGLGARRAMNVVGTPFVSPYWTLGSVQTLKGPVPRAWLKYDLVSGALLWRRPAGDSLDLDTEQITEFTLGDSLRGSRATFRRYLTARVEEYTLRTKFFEVRFDGGYSALLRQRTKQISHSSGGPSLTEARPDTWQESSRYFIKRHDNTIIPLRHLNTKGIFEVLESDKVPTLTAYVKQEHLSLSKEEDIIKMLRYYDTLL